MSERIRAVVVSEMTSLSVRTIQDLAIAGKLPGAAKLGGVWTFDRVKITDWAKKVTTPLPTDLTDKAEIIRLSIPWEWLGSGIYFLIKNDDVVYVGRAIEVAARVMNHVGKKDFDRWHWVPCAKEYLEEYERAYIDAFMPSMNMDPITIKRRREAANVR